MIDLYSDRGQVMQQGRSEGCEVFHWRTFNQVWFKTKSSYVSQRNCEDVHARCRIRGSVDNGPMGKHVVGYDF